MEVSDYLLMSPAQQNDDTSESPAHIQSTGVCVCVCVDTCV